MVKALLIFVLLQNNVDGTQTVMTETGPLPRALCVALASGILAQSYPKIGVDDDGLPRYQYEAVCANPVLAGQLGGGWRDVAGEAADKAEGAQQ